MDLFYEKRETEILKLNFKSKGTLRIAKEL